MGNSKQVNYWYSARRNEIFMDCDSVRAFARALNVVQRNLAQTHHIRIQRAWHFQSRQVWHSHLIIETTRPLRWEYRLGWANWSGSDRLRTSYVLARHAARMPHADLLVARKVYHREPDAVCTCKQKHIKDTVVRRCPALRKLLGRARMTDYFPRMGKPKPQGGFHLPWGEINLKEIQQ